MNGEAEKIIDLELGFTVGDWQVDPAANELHLDGETLKLEPKVMRVLCVLAEHPGSVVSREDLESRVWTGLVVTYDALSNTIIKLRKAFGDDPRNPRFIETISKSGYRLIAPVMPLPGTLPDGPDQDVASPPDNLIRKHWKLGLALLACLIAGVWLASRDLMVMDHAPDANVQTTATQPAIAVLPFDNLSKDPDQEYFSDGITEDLITDLSKLSGLLVVARNSAFAYKGSTLDEQTIGSELGVGYLLKGSVQRAGDRIRINVRLTDSGNGNNLWAERYDRQIGDLFAVQDELTAHIVSALEIELAPEDRDRLTRNYVASVQAYDELLKALDHYGRRSYEENELAQDHYEKAIELDPGYARAYAGLALVHSRGVLDGWDLSASDSLELAERLVEKAEQLDPSVPQIFFVKGQIETVRRNFEEAIRHTEHAIAMKPGYADAHALLAWILHFAGRPREGLESMERAVRLNPRVPSIYRMVRGALYYSQGKPDMALAELMPAVEINPSFQQLRIWLAAAYASAGRLEDAQWEAGEILALYPGFSVAAVERIFPIRDPAYLERFVADLRKTGLP